MSLPLTGVRLAVFGCCKVLGGVSLTGEQESRKYSTLTYGHKL